MVLDVARQAFYSSGGCMTRARNGEPERFYQEVVLTWASDDCLLWPYAKSHGYGVMGLPDKTVGLVHRRACEDVNGPPPNTDSLSLHSCGQGHNGCCNPKHTRWGNRSENMADATKHGVVPSKINEGLVRVIRGLRGIKSANAIADQFDISPASVNNILSGKSWSWVE